MEIEDPIVHRQMLRSFLWLNVLIDMTQPLTMGFWVPRWDRGNVWALVK